MDNIKKNNKLIVVCCILILFAIIYLFKDKMIFDKKFDYFVGDYIDKYSSNQYMPVMIEEQDIIKIYFNEYKNNVLFDTENAFNSLNKDYREKRFGTYDKYVEYLNNNMGDSTYNANIVKYSVNNIGGKKVYSCEDDSGYKYIFKENFIMNYEVYLDDNTVEIK